jgi:hypothetical protein
LATFLLIKAVELIAEFQVVLEMHQIIPLKKSFFPLPQPIFVKNLLEGEIS